MKVVKSSILKHKISTEDEEIIHLKLQTVIKVFIVVSIFSIYDFISLDGVRGAFFALLIQDTTLYSKSYSDAKFKAIKIGMDVDNVKEILGEPINIYQFDNIENYQYSMSSCDSHYRMRKLKIDRGKVINKIHYFYFD